MLNAPMNYTFILFFYRPSDPTWIPSDSDQRELYDLRKDPGTNNNVAGSKEYTKEVIEMDRLLRAGWRNALTSK